MVNLTIDGKNLEVPAGTTVLQAARSAGVQIPTLCDHTALKPFGGCRLCLVEVEGARTLQPSCTLPVNDNMVVLTSTDKVKAARKFVLTLIFSDRNHFCPFCQVSGGDCELQNAALDEGMSHWPYQPNWQPYTVDASHDYFVMDHNRCILCHRCVRACGELVGNFTLGIEERGSKSMLVADTGVPLGESTCVACGTCVSVCPTGALIERRSAYQGLETKLDETKTICAGCSVGCGVNVFTRDNRMVRILGDWEAPVNGGVLCKVGRFLPLEDDRQRITPPLVKKDGVMVPTTWDEALETIAARVKPLAGRNGDGLAALASTRLPVEALSLFKQVFGKGIGSDMVTSLEEGQATAVTSAMAEEFGRPFETNLESVKSADCVLAFGANLTEEHMVAGFMVKRNMPEGARLIVADPHENGLGVHANLNLKAVRGADLDVLNGLLAGLVRLGLVAGDVDGAETAVQAASLATGIPADDLLAAAGMLGTATRPVILYGTGLTVQSALPAVRALIALAQNTNAALLSLKGDANSVAAAQYSLEKPFHLNGHQAVYVALGDDTLSQRMLQQVEKAPFLAVQASYASRLTAEADVVLPVEMWAEQEGHFINLEGRVQKSNPALTAPENVRSNADALRALAARLDLQPDENWEAALCERPAPVAIPL